MKKKIDIALFFGKAGSGKDTLVKKLVEENNIFHKVIRYTTRPKRSNEVEGVDNFFISEEEMANKIIKNDIIFASVVDNGWAYGIGKDSFKEDKINVLISNPREDEFFENHNSNICPYHMKLFYLSCDDKIRLLRQLNREEKPDVKEIIRRFESDEKDFQFFKDLYEPIIFKNEDRKDLDRNIQSIINNYKQ